MLLRFTPTLKQLLFITVGTLNSFFVIAQTQIDDASDTSEWTDGFIPFQQMVMNLL